MFYVCGYVCVALYSMGRTLTELLTWEYLDKMAQLSHGKKNRGNTSKVLRSPSEPLIVLIEEIRHCPYAKEFSASVSSAPY